MSAANLQFIQEIHQQQKLVDKEESKFLEKYEKNDWCLKSVEEILKLAKPKNYIQKMALANLLFTKDRTPISYCFEIMES